MEEGFLLDRIHVNRARITVYQGVEPAPDVFSHTAKATLARRNHAAMRAETALNVAARVRGVAVGNGQRLLGDVVAGAAVQRAVAREGGVVTGRHRVRCRRLIRRSGDGTGPRGCLPPTPSAQAG